MCVSIIQVLNYFWSRGRLQYDCPWLCVCWRRRSHYHSLSWGDFGRMCEGRMPLHIIKTRSTTLFCFSIYSLLGISSFCCRINVFKWMHQSLREIVWPRMPEQHWLWKVLIVSSQSEPHSLKLLMLCLRCPFVCLNWKM